MSMEYIRWPLRKHINKSAWLGDQLGATSGIFQMVRAVWYDTFCEDSAATISAGLSECFEATQVWSYGRPQPDIPIPAPVTWQAYPKDSE